MFFGVTKKKEYVFWYPNCKNVIKIIIFIEENY